METLEECNFEQYVDSISKRALNQNMKHVLKEDGVEMEMVMMRRMMRRRRRMKEMVMMMMR